MTPGTSASQPWLYHPLMESLASRPEIHRTLVTRRRFLGVAGASLLGFGLYAGEIARHELVVERRTIALENLPEAFAGFRIVQVSDIHFAEYSEPAFVRRVVDRINQLDADVVVLTGDFVSMSPVRKDHAEAYIPMCAAILAGIRCVSRYAVLGNHDWMVNGTLVIEALEQIGIPVLQNLHVPLERGGRRVWIAGIRDALSGEADLKLALPPHAIADKEPVILLAHEPDLLDYVAPFGVDLMLSGHTHGGQVRLPFLRPVFLPPLGKIYLEGHFRKGRTQLYVNRGVGAVGLPFRLNCPPELTEITLARA